MTPHTFYSTPRANNSLGFTLVELAIALMIIGLLIAGVLKGQELVSNAYSVQITRQINAYRTAVTIFRSTYNMLPGDNRKPNRIPDCTTSPCNIAGNGDGLIGTAGQAASVIALPTLIRDEPRVFWVQLAKANLITGIDTTIANGSAFSGKMGKEIPATPVDGMGVGVNAYGADTFYGGPNTMKAGNYFILRGLDEVNGNPPISGRRGKFIDDKLDDGIALSGDVRALGIVGYSHPSWFCINYFDYQYNETNKGVGCNMQIYFE